MNIALIGMPCSYKTSVAKQLSTLINMMAFDTDEYIEFEKGMTVSEIFDKFGEKTFRLFERQTVEMALTFENAIISTGGGVVLNKTLMKRIKKECLVVYLYATPKTILNRSLIDNSRPKLSDGKLDTVEKLFLEREPLYREYADLIVNTNNTKSINVTKKLYDIIISQDNK